MKKQYFNRYSIGTLTLVVLMMSCVSDLDVKPIDPFVTTADKVYTTKDSYKEGLAKLYATFALTGQRGPAGNQDVGGVDEGFSCFVRSLWYMQELTTDEAVWSYPNDANGTIFNLHYNTWLPSDGIPEALYARIANVAALSNEFIRVTTGKTDDPDFKNFQAEARFLRALAYFYGMDLYGRLPFLTEKDQPGSFFPPMILRPALFDYIEKELKAIKADMGAPRFEYGRADKAACAMLLAKLYLNAEVYIGTPKYTEALTELNEIIAAGYTLSPRYANLFRADNDKNNTEIIFAQAFDGAKSQAYAMTQVMINGNAGNGGWSGLRTTSAFVGKFPNLAEARAIFADKNYNEDPITTRSLEIDNVAKSGEGWGIYKFRNITSTGVDSPNSSTGFPDTDYPMFRLADAYLMYAEAVIRGGTGGTRANALTYINSIRSRSGDVIAGNAPGLITDPQMTLDFILDERARELYWEGHRRMDLIRFGKFTGGSYLWPWKGGVKNGTAIDDKYKIFPIPSSDLGTNPNLKQSDGY
ncbi:MAG: RagB/SusD family nutrient uptake outer membrane protein [Flammeovirgaceae bacterium]|nr:RagB/SusD family nutrient uptake outer membrane protein [Flammeovirgaceae bacterium]